jgi:hypothetical protein
MGEALAYASKELKSGIINESPLEALTTPSITKKPGAPSTSNSSNSKGAVYSPKI